MEEHSNSSTQNQNCSVWYTAEMYGTIWFQYLLSYILRNNILTPSDLYKNQINFQLLKRDIRPQYSMLSVGTGNANI